MHRATAALRRDGFGSRLRPTLAAAAALVLVAACGGRGATAGERPSGAPPLHMGGQRVLLLPVQAPVTLPVDRAALDAEIHFAFAERDSRVVWIAPDELRQALRRAPGFASDPGALPSDPLLHHGERRAVEPLAGEIRRFSALTDARLVFLPRAAVLSDTAADQGIRVNAALLDARSGNVVWWGEARGSAAEGRAALATLAGELAQRLIAGAAPGVRP